MKRRRKFVQPEDLLLAEAGVIREAIHKDEPRARTAKEQEAECVMGGIQCVIETLLGQGVDLSIIETCLLYWFVSFAAWNRNASAAQLNRWTSDMHTIAKILVEAMKQLCNEIEDDGPTLAMRALGDRLDQVKMLLDKPQELSQPEVELQTEKAMRCLHIFYETCRKHRFDGMLIETSFFYYWLRTSTLREGVAEKFFQKIERNWTESVRRKHSVLAKLARTGWK